MQARAAARGLATGARWVEYFIFSPFSCLLYTVYFLTFFYPFGNQLDMTASLLTGLYNYKFSQTNSLAMLKTFAEIWQVDKKAMIRNRYNRISFPVLNSKRPLPMGWRQVRDGWNILFSLLSLVYYIQCISSLFSINSGTSLIWMHHWWQGQLTSNWVKQTVRNV